MKKLASALFLLAAIAPAYAQRLPSIVPNGWRQESADPETSIKFSTVKAIWLATAHAGTTWNLDIPVN